MHFQLLRAGFNHVNPTPRLLGRLTDRGRSYPSVVRQRGFAALVHDAITRWAILTLVGAHEVRHARLVQGPDIDIRVRNDTIGTAQYDGHASASTRAIDGLLALTGFVITSTNSRAIRYPTDQSQT